MIDLHAHVVLEGVLGRAGELGPELIDDPDCPTFRVGDYVLGIEPGTARIVDRPQLRAAGELPEIAPGETRRFDLEVGVLEGRAECDAFRA